MKKSGFRFFARMDHAEIIAATVESMDVAQSPPVVAAAKPPESFASDAKPAIADANTTWPRNDPSDMKRAIAKLGLPDGATKEQVRQALIDKLVADKNIYEPLELYMRLFNDAGTETFTVQCKAGKAPFCPRCDWELTTGNVDEGVCPKCLGHVHSSRVGSSTDTLHCGCACPYVCDLCQSGSPFGSPNTPDKCTAPAASAATPIPLARSSPCLSPWNGKRYMPPATGEHAGTCTLDPMCIVPAPQPEQTARAVVVELCPMCRGPLEPPVARTWLISAKPERAPTAAEMSRMAFPYAVSAFDDSCNCTPRTCNCKPTCFPTRKISMDLRDTVDGTSMPTDRACAACARAPEAIPRYDLTPESGSFSVRCCRACVCGVISVDGKSHLVVIN